MDGELTPDEIDALLGDDDETLKQQIDGAYQDSADERLAHLERRLMAAIVAQDERVDAKRKLHAKCIQVALEARGNGRQDLYAAARERESKVLGEVRAEEAKIPRIEAGLRRVRALMRRRT